MYEGVDCGLISAVAYRYAPQVLKVGKDEIRPSHTLAGIIARAFPEEYEERRREAAGQQLGQLELGEPGQRMEPKAPAAARVGPAAAPAAAEEAA